MNPKTKNYTITDSVFLQPCLSRHTGLQKLIERNVLPLKQNCLFR